jgi:hypothetical protein
MAIKVFLDGMRNIEANPYHIDGKSVLKWTEQGVVGRYKQWLAMLTQGWPEAKLLFEHWSKKSVYIRKDSGFSLGLCCLSLGIGSFFKTYEVMMQSLDF